MIHAPVGGIMGMQYTCGDFLGTRPSNTAWGVSLTPGNNAYSGTWTPILTAATITRDLFGLLIYFSGAQSSGATRDLIAKVGIDPAGGTAYNEVISHLLASCAPNPANGGGIYYYFPLWIKAGSQIAVDGSVNNVTVGTFRCSMMGVGDPVDPRSAKVCTFVETIGANAAASNGTAVTAGGASEGAWTSLGTTAKDTWWHQAGFGCSSATMNGGAYAMELGVGDGTTGGTDIMLRDAHVLTSTAESINFGPHMFNNSRKVVGGSTVYGRAQCSTTADTGTSMIAYCAG